MPRLRFWRRRRKTDPAALADAHERINELERRADRVVPRIVAEGNRNNFAERLRGTLPHTNGV